MKRISSSEILRRCSTPEGRTAAFRIDRGFDFFSEGNAAGRFCFDLASVIRNENCDCEASMKVFAPTSRIENKIPPLEPGDHLTRREFERRYQNMPNVKKAELIEGLVYI